MSPEIPIYVLTPPFLYIKEEANFSDSWEVFCHFILCLKENTNDIQRRHKPEYGIDLYYEDKKIAYQCKSVESGVSSKLNVSHIISSIKSAVEAKRNGIVDWDTFYVCTNVNITGKKIASIKEVLPEVKIIAETQWQNLCRKYTDEVSSFFRRLTEAEDVSKEQTFNLVDSLTIKSKNLVLPASIPYDLYILPISSHEILYPIDNNHLKILVLREAPGIDEVKGYSKYFKLISKFTDFFLKTHGPSAPELTRGGRITPNGNYYIWGELQPQSESEIELDMIAYLLLEHILFCYRMLAYRNWFGRINLHFKIENVRDRRLQMRDPWRDIWNIYQLDDQTDLEVTEEGFFTKNPISALELCFRVVEKVCLSFGFSDELSHGDKIGIDKELVISLLKREKSHRYAHRYENSFFPPLDIDLSDLNLF